MRWGIIYTLAGMEAFGSYWTLMSDHSHLSELDAREWRSIQVQRLPRDLLPQLGFSLLICYLAGSAGPARSACLLAWMAIVCAWDVFFYRQDTCGWHSRFHGRWLPTPITLACVLLSQVALIGVLWIAWRPA